MSIVRIGLAETKHFSEGWDAIFGNKKKKPRKTVGSAKPSKRKKKTNKKG